MRVWVEMFTPTLTSNLPVAGLVSVTEPVEASLLVVKPVASIGSETSLVTDSAADAALPPSAPSNLYGIKYPFSSICLSAS